MPAKVSKTDRSSRNENNQKLVNGPPVDEPAPSCPLALLATMVDDDEDDDVDNDENDCTLLLWLPMARCRCFCTWVRMLARYVRLAGGADCNTSRNASSLEVRDSGHRQEPSPTRLLSKLMRTDSVTQAADSHILRNA